MWTKTALLQLREEDLLAVAIWGGLRMPGDATKEEIAEAVLIMAVPWTPVPIPPRSAGTSQAPLAPPPERLNPSVRIRRIQEASKAE